MFYGRNLYCKNTPTAINRWPRSYSASLQILRKAGYTDPVTHFICLDLSHPHQWSSSEDPEGLCSYCKKPGNIKYYHLDITDKVKRWCQSCIVSIHFTTLMFLMIWSLMQCIHCCWA